MTRMSTPRRIPGQAELTGYFVKLAMAGRHGRSTRSLSKRWTPYGRMRCHSCPPCRSTMVHPVSKSTHNVGPFTGFFFESRQRGAADRSSPPRRQAKHKQVCAPLCWFVSACVVIESLVSPLRPMYPFVVTHWSRAETAPKHRGSALGAVRYAGRSPGPCVGSLSQRIGMQLWIRGSAGQSL